MGRPSVTPRFAPPLPPRRSRWPLSPEERVRFPRESWLTHVENGNSRKETPRLSPSEGPRRRPPLLPLPPPREARRSLPRRPSPRLLARVPPLSIPSRLERKLQARPQELARSPLQSLPRPPRVEREPRAPPAP